MDVVVRVLSFWYNEENPDPSADGSYRSAWFKKDSTFDKQIRDQFETDVIAAANGQYKNLCNTPAGALTLSILLDQFPRNLYRGSPRAFATDTLALKIAKQAIKSGFDLKLGKTRRMFLYLPFEHSENLKDQDMAVRLFKASKDDQTYPYALEHYYVISRFGRFPSRNPALNRESTADEVAFLKLFGGY